MSAIDTVTNTKKLLKQVVVSVLVAACLLFLVVLPSGYGVDPSGLGNCLTKLHCLQVMNL
jgi:hypothetical protein